MAWHDLARIEFPGAHYRVMSRGNGRKPIVRDALDREKWMDWLRRTVETYGWRLHAFASMTNHDHIGGIASAPIVAAYHNQKLVPVSVLMAMIGYAIGSYGAFLAAWLCLLVS